MLLAGAGLLATGSRLVRARAEGSTVKGKFDIERFVEDVRRAQREKDSQAAVEEVLARAVSDPAAVLDGIGEPAEAGIHPLHHAADLTILNVVWAPLMVLLPH